MIAVKNPQISTVLKREHLALAAQPAGGPAGTGQSAAHLGGLPSCRRSQHPQSWWRSRVCSAAAYGAWLPDKTHFLQLQKTND